MKYFFINILFAGFVSALMFYSIQGQGWLDIWVVLWLYSFFAVAIYKIFLEKENP